MKISIIKNWTSQRIKELDQLVRWINLEKQD